MLREPKATMSPEHRSERVTKLTIAGFAGVLLITIVVSIHLSTLGLSFGSLLYGSSVVWRGHSASFRAAAIDPQSSSLLPELTATFSLRDTGGVRAESTATGMSFAETTFDIPRNLGRHPVLAVTLRTRHGTDSFEVPLRSVAHPGSMQGRIATHTEALAKDAPTSRGAYNIAAYPVGGTVVAGLENRVDARITDHDDKPFKGRIRSQVIGLDTQSDAFGLFSFTYRPPPKPAPLHFEIGTSPSFKATVPLDVQASQLLLEVKPRTLMSPAGLLDLTVRTLPFRDPVHIDIWIGNALVLCTSEPADGGLRELEVVLPKEISGFVRIDAYRNFLAAEDSLKSRLLWVNEEPSHDAAGQAIEALASFPGGDDILALAKSADAAAKPRLLELGASRFVPKSQGAPLLRSTLEARKASVEAKRGRLRGHLNTLFILTLGLGLGLAVAWIIHHQITVKRAVQGVVDEGLCAGEDLDAEGMKNLVRFRHLYDLALALGALVLAGYAIYVLLVRITWS